jgi:2-haloacid dehalogenase
MNKSLSTDQTSPENNAGSAGPGSPENLSRRRLLTAACSASLMLLARPLPAYAQTTVANGVQALCFDVFGTVVDWRGSIIREGQLLSANTQFAIDWADFADRWRAGYGPAMNRVRTGELGWRTIDQLHRMILDELIEEFGLQTLSEAEREHLNRAWHRLSPWPDAVAGLNRLKSRFIITTLSNGNVSLLTNMARNAGLPWDAILSAELAGQYKPDLAVYRKAASLLDLDAQQVMMVAAHPGDLRAAARAGLRTAYVHRPLERGPQGRVHDISQLGEFDYLASDFLDLAVQLGA